MLNHSRINTSAHICDVNRRRNAGICVAPCAGSCVRAHFASVSVLPLRSIDFKVLVVMESVAVFLGLQNPLESTNGRKLAPHAKCTWRGKIWNGSTSKSQALVYVQTRHSFKTHHTVQNINIIPVFPAASPLPYRGCSFSPAGCRPSGGPPGLWPLQGQPRVLEPAPLLRRRRRRPGERKEFLRCEISLDCADLFRGHLQLSGSVQMIII